MLWCYYSFCEYRGLLPVPLLSWMTSVSLWQYSSLERDLSARFQCFTSLHGQILLFANLSYIFLKTDFWVGLGLVLEVLLGGWQGKPSPLGPQLANVRRLEAHTERWCVSVLHRRTLNPNSPSALPRTAALLPSHENLRWSPVVCGILSPPGILPISGLKIMP